MKNRIWALLIAMAMLLTLAPAALAETATGTGTAKGYGGDISVTVTLEDGVITDVQAVGDSETDGIGGNIIKEWPEAFVAANGIVDTYTGATFAMVTRPAFIEATRAALTEAGVNPDDYMREYVEEAAEDETLETDIVIVGAGGAGMTAAIVAADAGMNVVLLESQPAVGGNSVKSTGGMNAAKTAYQDKNTFAENAGVEKQLKAAEGYADNQAVAALHGDRREQLHGILNALFLLVMGFRGVHAAGGLGGVAAHIGHFFKDNEVLSGLLQHDGRCHTGAARADNHDVRIQVFFSLGAVIAGILPVCIQHGNVRAGLFQG